MGLSICDTVNPLVILFLQGILTTCNMTQLRTPPKIKGLFSEESLQRHVMPRLEKLLIENPGKQLSPLSYQSLYQSYQNFGNAITLGVYSLVMGSLTWVTLEIVTNTDLLCSTVFVTC